MTRRNIRLAALCAVLSVTLSLVLLSCAGTKQTASGGKDSDRPDSCDTDRSNYGRAKNLPFWCELTEFELMALEGAEKAREGDPDALFALAVFASGDVRDAETFKRYQDIVHGFIRSVRDTLQKIDAPYDKGRVLYGKMCTHFFKHKFGSDEMKGYEFDQSRITGIFQTGRYNCVSSALLYMVLARFIGIKVKAVVLPSHVFVQLDLPDGKKVEVETTVHTGYDEVHDREYYKKNGRWFGRRGLNQSTYDDYVRRRIITPLDAVCGNMNNQHTEERRMARKDRDRLCEAQGFLAPHDSTCAENRLIILHNEFLEMKRCEDHASMQRMFSIVTPDILSTKERWQSNPTILTRCAEFELHHAHALFLAGKPDSAISIIDGLDSSPRFTAEGKESFRLSVMSMIHVAVETMSNLKRYDDCVRVLKKVESIQFVSDSLPTMYSYFYNTWGARLEDGNDHLAARDCFRKAFEYARSEAFRGPARRNVIVASLNYARELMEKKEWEQAMSQCGIAIEYADADELKRHVGDFRSAIYTNWGNDLSGRDDFEPAVEKYGRALETASDSGSAKLIRKNISILYARWAVCLEKKRDIAGAKTIVERCIRECPDAGECYKVKRSLAAYR